MASINCQVAIIGAGPYGLSAAAHLRAAQMDVHIFGEPMGFWRTGMPQGMVLRSLWHYSHISDPGNACTVDRFAETQKLPLPANLRLEQFVSYGAWFQQQLVPQVDRRVVLRIERTERGFLLLLGDGETCAAQRVVVATGLAYHKRRPAQFHGLPRDLCSHASEHSRFARFAGRRVAVIGAGQSALESAVLLREAGAEAELIVRAPAVYWLGEGSGPANLLRGLLRPVMRRFLPPPHIGTFPLNCMLERPGLFRLVPADVRSTIARWGHRACGAAWLRPRAAGLPISAGASVISATPHGSRIDLKLDDGSQRPVDHVLLATGFRFNLFNLPFLPAGVVSEIRSVRNYPVLSTSMESSIPGLHFIGAAASDAYGPAMNFVCGTAYCSRNLTRAVCSQRAWPALAPRADAVTVKN